MSDVKANTDSRAIAWFLDHARENVYPTPEMLEERLRSGKRLRAYVGVDPTGPTLHLGHFVALTKLGELQRLGHEVILLIGDFTAMIGDPTDKSAVRKQLTREQVLDNCRLYQQQAARVLAFDGPNPAQLKFNSAWLALMSFADVIELASHFTVQQMMERDMFEKRIVENKPVYLHEFLYPLMQGYDSVAMDVDLEIGGNDQTFNMLAGRTLMREIKKKDKAVLTCRLLADATGKKMGKTEGNMIALTDTPEDMFGKVMSWPDEMILPGFEICTDTALADVEKIKTAMGNGENPMAFKRDLAYRIVRWLSGEEAADRGREYFVKVHQGGEMPEDMPRIFISADAPVSVRDLLVEAGFASSKTEAWRQIEQGAVQINQSVVADPQLAIRVPPEGVILQKGKRSFVHIKKV